MSEEQKNFWTWMVTLTLAGTVIAALVFTIPPFVTAKRVIYKDKISVSAAVNDEQEVTVYDRINLNTATVEELMALSGIGETYANRIVEYREQHGGFLTVEELTAVKGIGEKRLAEIAPYVTVE